MTFRLKTLIVVSTLMAVSSAWAASTKQEVQELREQVKALQEGQAAMQKDLDELLKLVRQGAQGAPAASAFAEQDVDIGPSPFLGDESAPVTLIEYSDYQCPFCSRHYRDVMPSLVNEYVDTGKLKYVMRENPIASIHPQAVDASLAALCAGEQGKYWEMSDVLFANQKSLGVENLKTYAVDLGLDRAAFDQCLDSRKYEKQVNDDLSSGSKLGVRGTPGFVLGLTDPDDSDQARMTVYIRGAQPLDNFKRAIDGLLADVD